MTEEHADDDGAGVAPPDRPPDDTLAEPAYGAETVRFTFPPRPELVAMARSLVASLARQQGLNDAEVEDLRLVVSEACTNAVRVQRERGITAPITLVCTVNDVAGVEVIDAAGGMYLEPTEHFPAPTNGEGVEGGYGIPLMKRVADMASFEGNGNGGTTVRLRLGPESTA